MAYVVEKAGLHYAVIYQGVNPITGKERRRWHRQPRRRGASAGFSQTPVVTASCGVWTARELGDFLDSTRSDRSGCCSCWRRRQGCDEASCSACAGPTCISTPAGSRSPRP